MDEQTTQTPPVPPIATKPPTAEDIAARLSKTPGNIETTPTAPNAKPIITEPTASEPAPAFDISKLSPEMLIALKAALENAPLRQTKKGNPTIKLRRMNDRFVLDFGTCVNALRKDEFTQTTTEVVFIPVKFMDGNGKPDAQFTNVIYRDFMNAEQVKCEIIGSRDVPDSIIQGEVESNERPGVMVELEVKVVKTFLTIKLPADAPVPQIEIEAKIANA